MKWGCFGALISYSMHPVLTGAWENTIALTG